MGLFGKNLKEKKQELVGETIARHGLDYTTRIDGPRLLNFVLLFDDNSRRLHCLEVTDRGRDYVVTTCGYEDIMSASIEDDGATIIKRSAGGVIGGALAGSVIAGGIGAILGGLSGKQVQSKTHKQLKVIIKLRNTLERRLELLCLFSLTPVFEYESAYAEGIAVATRILDEIDVILDERDRG